MEDTFILPPAIAALVEARDRVRDHYAAILQRQKAQADLRFTFDGNLVGDIGEAIAAELFGVQLVKAKSTKGIDGRAADGRTVQVKATGTGRGPAFRCIETRADHLLFFDLDLESGTGTVIFNGPERYATDRLPASFTNQRSVSAKQIREAAKRILPSERLARIDLVGG